MNIDLIVPYRLEDRPERYKRIIYKKIQDYIKNGSKGDLELIESPKIDLPSTLTSVGRSLNLGESKIKEINHIKSIGLFLFLDRSEISKLPDNLTVGDYLSVEDCKSLRELPNNLTISGNLWINNSSISDIPKNLKIGKDLHINATPLYRNYTEEEIRKMIEDGGGYLKGTIKRF